ncbi:hypothetical protein [Aurantiacibacter sediminis]|uniref:Uncharacterized protein n=1 Tax=Aurantiacibacter sediminis TaxID=2793064 RepID=A0ABS0N2N4_9SPHN|nr:hypothetical protein [Aurantiacibacter sediminis]MBH5322223.1 hypothetical protein [Aurantiacibacter sediminis]
MPHLRDRLPALAALAIPVLVGAAWMTLAGAPAHYAVTNLGVLAVMLVWIAVGRGPHTSLSRHMLLAALLVILVSPIWIGPEMTSVTGHRVARWFPLGSLNLHTGMIAAPALAVLAARHRYGAAFLLLGVGAAFLQPDAATGFALTIAAVGIHHVKRDWKYAVAAILGFLASIQMTLRGELPPQHFIERVLVDAASDNIFAAIALGTALLAAFLIMLFALPLSREKRFAIGGTLFGFSMIAMMSSYPYPLIGYGAAPIIGFGLALGLKRIPRR